MLKPILTVLILEVSLALSPMAAQEDKARSTELVQYVRDARKAGFTDSQIAANTVKAGWPADDVNAAVARLRAGVAPEAEAKSGADRGASTAASAGLASNAGETPPAATIPAATPPLDKNRGVPDDYTIGAGDVLQISVWKEPDASVPHAVVRPDGKITLPLLKEVSVVGLTPTELEKIATAQLGSFINSPDVTVVVTGINSKKVYVVGAVKKEGPIAYTYQMSVMQAISEAGGLTDYAKRKKIYVLRKENGRDYRLPFDYDAVLRGERMETNILLMAGDTLVVPK